MKIITLIQSKPNMYKMEGNNILRIVHDMPTIEKRTQVLNSLFELLGA